MNQCYKTIYSKIHQCFVVVSELTKSHGKGSRASRVLRTVLLGACLAGLGQQAAWGAQATKASVNISEDTPIAPNDASSAWGVNTEASNKGATAFGENTKAEGVNSTVWGYSTSAGEKEATAWGNSQEILKRLCSLSLQAQIRFSKL